MKITRKQLRNIISEAVYGYQGKKRSYNQASPGMKSMAMSAKRKFAKEYPNISVKIDGRNGWIIVDDKKAVNISSANSRPMDIEEMIEKMKKAYLG